MNQKQFLLTSVLSLLLIFSFAQERTVKGVISVPGGEPLQGVKISVEGSNKKAVSDQNGNYEIIISTEIANLILSHPKWKEMKVTVGINDIMNVEMLPKDADDLYALSFEELMQVDVSSATKSDITIQKAPSVIRVYNQDDFKRMGLHTLNDVLTTIPGIQMQQYRAGHQLVWTRGVQQRYNNKVLLLIDGVPMRDSYYGNFNVDEMIPLSVIEKVEIINGPGSVLYGANSFSGVISVITKKEGRSVEADYGTYNSVSVGGEYNYKGLYANVDYYQTDGFHPEYNADGYKREHRQEADNTYALLKYQNDALTLIGSITSYNYPYKFRSSTKDYYFNRMPVYGAAGYKFDLEEKGTVNTLAYYNYFGFNIDKIKFEDETSNIINEKSVEYLNTSILGADVDYSVNVNKHSFTAGISFQQDMAHDIHEQISYDIDEGNIDIKEDNITEPDVTRNSVGLFLQDVWTLNDFLLFTAGIRYDILSDFDNQFNYRFGLTGQSASNVYGKLLFGTAYRVPSYREYLDAASYNPELKPEHLSTFEAQAGYLFSKGEINLTFFYNSYKDFIQEIVVDSVLENDGSYREVDDEMAFNFNKRDLSGLELVANLYPAQNLYLNMGASVLLKKSENSGDITGVFPIYQNPGEIDITLLSDYTLNFQVSYMLPTNTLIGVNAIYFGDRSVPSNYQEDVPEEVQNANNANGFLKLDFHANQNIAGKFDIFFKFSNLFNDKYYSPPYGGATGYDIEWQPFVYKIGARYTFK